MNTKSLYALGIPLIVLVFLSLTSLFVVSQSQQAIVLEFGRLVRVVKDPGLNFKIPFIQDVIIYDKRILAYDMDEVLVTLGDQKRVLVNTFTRYRIKEPDLFYRRVRNEAGAQQRIQVLNESIVLSVLGRVTLTDLLSPKRTAISETIQNQLDSAAAELGIEVLDLRLVRTDLPLQNQEAIFNRMISARQQEAQELRSQGDEIAQEIRSQAERERTEIVAIARKESEILRGQADAYVTDVAAKAYGKDEEFYAFYKTMNAYLESLKDDGKSYIMSPKNEFFRYFNHAQ